MANEKNQWKYDMDMFIYILDQTKRASYKLLISSLDVCHPELLSGSC